jgi:hypothetical protein
VAWPIAGQPIAAGSITAQLIVGGIILIAEQRSGQQRWERRRPTAPTARAITIKALTAMPTAMCNVPSIDAPTGASDSGCRTF